MTGGSSCDDGNFYPRSPCGERRPQPPKARVLKNFYPRSPCGERHITTITICTAWIFLSTLSLRRATSPCCGWFEVIHYFYPRSPCGERLLAVLMISLLVISIHALLAESDPQLYATFMPLVISIHALLAESDRRGAANCYLDNIISIHALLAESDFACAGWFQVVYYFYPRSPCGERHGLILPIIFRILFLSTLSLRRATNGHETTLDRVSISIHALLAESDATYFF